MYLLVREVTQSGSQRNYFSLVKMVVHIPRVSNPCQSSVSCNKSIMFILFEQSLLTHYVYPSIGHTNPTEVLNCMHELLG